jgi:uncharacterized membrane protein (DUF485 family)
MASEKEEEGGPFSRQRNRRSQWAASPRGMNCRNGRKETAPSDHFWPAAPIIGIVTIRGTPMFTLPMPPAPSHDDVVHSESFLRSLMRRQLALSASCAATILVALVGMPLLNYFAPEAMSTRIGGFTLSWLVLGVLFFPFVWIISFVFIKRSIALEEEEVAQVQRGKERR